MAGSAWVKEVARLVCVLHSLQVREGFKNKNTTNLGFWLKLEGKGSEGVPGPIVQKNRNFLKEYWILRNILLPFNRIRIWLSNILLPLKGSRIRVVKILLQQNIYRNILK